MCSYRDPSAGRSFVTQHFLNAKNNLSKIFEKLKQCEEETIKFMQVNSLGSKDDNEEIRTLYSRSENIQGALARDNLKLAVFGRTSNGKSTVINAILGKEILPTGCGDTTNCIIQIEGAETAQAYMIRDNSGVRENISNISAADALSDDAIQDCTTIVQIYWPRNRCELLRDNVVIVDTPGADKADIIDEAVEMNWLNADVHIFVVNADSGIANSERKLMKMLSQKLSIPNVFILINKWDKVISNTESQKMQKLHAKYIEEAVDLLTNKLQTARTGRVAKQRIFFISAERVLKERLNEEDAYDKPELSLCYSEFEKFEKKCGECISNTALTTKIANHAQSGKEICSSLLEIFPGILTNVSSEITKISQKKMELCEAMNQTKKDYENMNIKTILSSTVKASEHQLKKELDHGMVCLKRYVNNYGSIPHEEEAARRWIDSFKDGFSEVINNEISKKLTSRYNKTIDDIQKVLASATIRKKKMLELLTHREMTMEDFLALQEELFTDSQTEFNANINMYLPSASGHAPDSQAVTTTRDVFIGLTPSIGSIAAIPTPPTIAVALIGSIISGIGAIISSVIRKNVFAAKETEIREKYNDYIRNDVQGLVTSKTEEFSTLLKTYTNELQEKFCDIVDERDEQLQNDIQILDGKLVELNEQYNKIEKLQSKTQNIATDFNIFVQECINQ